MPPPTPQHRHSPNNVLESTREYVGLSEVVKRGDIFGQVGGSDGDEWIARKYSEIVGVPPSPAQLVIKRGNAYASSYATAPSQPQ